MDKILHVSIIGCGMRSRCVIAQFQRELKEKLKIQAVYDPCPESIALAAKYWKIPSLKSEENMEKAIDRADVDVVMIFSPNAFHCQAILAALAARKKVFSENACMLGAPINLRKFIMRSMIGFTCPSLWRLSKLPLLK